MTNLCMLLKQKSIQRQKMLFLTEIAVIAFFYKSLAKDVWHRYLKTLLQKPYPSNICCCTYLCILFPGTSQPPWLIH